MIVEKTYLSRIVVYIRLDEAHSKVAHVTNGIAHKGLGAWLHHKGLDCNGPIAKSQLLADITTVL